MTGRMLATLMAFLALAACQTRSISDSGFYDQYAYAGNRNPFYQGEIDELDLIVPQGEKLAAESEIAQALAVAKPIGAVKNQPLLVVQSGAIMPDELMMQALSADFAAAPFSGIPPRKEASTSTGPLTYGERLRLAAANGGFHQIFVYWGMLETAQTDGPTKVISWVPIIGAVVPDESQRMRIQLKGALIDVVSGRWRMFQPEPIEDSAISASINRVSSDQDQVGKLKQIGYVGLARLLADSAVPLEGN